MNSASRLPRTGPSLRDSAWALLLTFVWLSACSSDDAPGPANTGQACDTADACYTRVESGELRGEAVCLARVDSGYCTHHCQRDTDCCAVEGECDGQHAEVCAPFESTGEMYCFLSCEDEDLAATNLSDADLFCQRYAGASFHCRSTGGGSANRKVCVP